MRRAGLIAFLTAVLAVSAQSLPSDPPALQPRAGTGIFLLLSDIHFDPYADPAILEQLGVKPLPACQAPAAAGFAKLGSDTNFPLLKSTLDNVAATAAQNHIHYDYVIITGDLLSHGFDGRYHECVGGGAEAYQQFANGAISFVDAMIAKALPGVPVFAALGNNDTDKGDYAKPSPAFLQNVANDWSPAWGNISVEAKYAAVASIDQGGYYAVPNPSVPNDELIVLNSNLWVARETHACTDLDPDPSGQFAWLGNVLTGLKAERRTATLIMHVLPGIDGLRSSMGQPQSLWTDQCTQKFIGQLSDFRGVVREIYAGHIHRDDFRILPDRDGKPLLPIHIVPAVSPVYFNNPAVEIGWYDKHNGDLADYAPIFLDLTTSQTTWATEYIFSQAYGLKRPDLASLRELAREIHTGNPVSGVGKDYAKYYTAGVGLFLTPDNWRNYSCTQSAITLSVFAQCKNAGAQPQP